MHKRDLSMYIFLYCFYFLNDLFGSISYPNNENKFKILNVYKADLNVLKI